MLGVVGDSIHSADTSTVPVIESIIVLCCDISKRLTTADRRVVDCVFVGVQYVIAKVFYP